MNWLRYSSNIFIFRIWLFQITFQLRLAGNHVFPWFVPAGVRAEGLTASLKRDLSYTVLPFKLLTSLHLGGHLPSKQENGATIKDREIQKKTDRLQPPHPDPRKGAQSRGWKHRSLRIQEQRECESGAWETVTMGGLPGSALSFLILDGVQDSQNFQGRCVVALWGADKVTLGQGSWDSTAGNQGRMQVPRDGHESRGMRSSSDSSGMSYGPALVSDIGILYLLTKT